MRGGEVRGGEARGGNGRRGFLGALSWTSVSLFTLCRKRQDFLARERQRLMQLEQRGEMSVEDERDLKKLVSNNATASAASAAC